LSSMSHRTRSTASDADEHAEPASERCWTKQPGWLNTNGMNKLHLGDYPGVSDG
jgi:hypothetical protein